MERYWSKPRWNVEEYKSQFTQDETIIGTTPLTKMTIDTGNSEPVLQKHYPIAMKHYNWVKDKINKLLTAKVIRESLSSWSAPIIVVPKGEGRWGKMSSYQTLCTQQDHMKIYLTYAKGRGHFSQLNGMKYPSTLDLWAGYHHIPLGVSSIPKTTFISPFRKYEYIKVPFRLTQVPAYFQELMTGSLKDFPFTIAYLDDIIIFSRTAEEHLDCIRQVFKKKLQDAHLSMKLSKVTSVPKRSSTLDTSSATQASDHYHWKLKPSTTYTHPKQLNRYAHS